MSEYTFTSDVHSDRGALETLKFILGAHPPASLLDVGCGGGTWMRAAKNLGIETIVGVDSNLHVDAQSMAGRFIQRDLTQPLDLGERFDVVVCVEVAEHLPESAADTLIGSLCRHSDRIFFSAACPRQHGQHHVNCQWPGYWQALFNAKGFVCDDAIRWRIWDEREVEPWYRQNLFIAHKSPAEAGAEPRLRSVIHPDMTPYLYFLDQMAVEAGRQPVVWYLAGLIKAVRSRLGGRS